MDNETEMIKHQMEETRSSLTEKLETLEEKVVDTVEGTTHAVTDTVENVKEAVEETVEKVKDSVTTTVKTVTNLFNLKLQTERHPWVMMGGSVAAGFVLGRLQDRVFSQSPALASCPPVSTGRWEEGYAESRRPETGYAASAPPARESWLSGLTSLFGPEINKLKSLAIGTLFGAAREMISKAVPGEIGNRITEVIDRITTKLGGEPLPASALHQEGADGPSSSATGRQGTPAFR
jgi:hypothetical protein